jgi:hypothetical protein
MPFVHFQLATGARVDLQRESPEPGTRMKRFIVDFASVVTSVAKGREAPTALLKWFGEIWTGDYVLALLDLDDSGPFLRYLLKKTLTQLRS